MVGIVRGIVFMFKLSTVLPLPSVEVLQFSNVFS